MAQNSPLTSALFAKGLIESDFVSVDIGARDPDKQPLSLILEGIPRERLVVYGFDPDEEICNALNENSKASGRKDRFWPHGILDFEGHADFFLTKVESASSFMRPNKKAADRIDVYADCLQIKKEFKFPVRRLDNWAAENDIRNVDYLKLNIQGTELKALSGGVQVLDSVKGIVVEYGLIESYEGRSLLSDIETFLRPLGFQCFDLIFNCRWGRSGFPRELHDHYKLDHPIGFRGQLVEGHALYLRDPIAVPSEVLFPDPRMGDDFFKLVCFAEIIGQLQYAFELLEWGRRTLGADGQAAKARLLENVYSEARHKYGEKIRTREIAQDGQAQARKHHREDEIDALMARNKSLVELMDTLRALYEDQAERLKSANAVLLRENMELKGFVTDKALMPIDSENRAQSLKR